MVHCSHLKREVSKLDCKICRVKKLVQFRGTIGKAGLIPRCIYQSDEGV